MKLIKNWICSDHSIQQNSVIWNAIAAVMNSFQTMLLLFVILRVGNTVDSSIFVMAYAVGNLALNIGKYGVRQYQVTDVMEEYSVADYIKCRYYSMALLGLFVLAYLGYNGISGRYSADKVIVVFFICAFKAMEAFEDVFHGYMQQHGRLDIASRVLGSRLFIFILGFAITYAISKDLIITCLVNVVLGAFIAVILNKIAMSSFTFQYDKQQATKTLALLKTCLPLCACMCLNMYIANAPKYTIDVVVSDLEQTCFNVVFMPVFVIALLGNFIFQPYLKRMGELWESNQISKLLKDVAKLAFLVVLIDLIVVVVGAFIGGPILGFIYNVDLKSYNTELIIFMIVGGVIALQNLLIMLVTTMRYHGFMIWGYIGVALISFFGGSLVVKAYGLIGLSYFFLATMIGLALYCTVLVYIAIKHKAKVK